VIGNPDPEVTRLSVRSSLPLQRRLSAVLALSVAAGLAATNPAAAPSPDPSDGLPVDPTMVQGRLEGVTVTATRSAREPFALAESVSVVDRDAIETAQPLDLGDLLQDLANVSIGGGPRGVAQQVVIRGVGDDRILFLLDGARQNFSRAHNGRVFVDPELLKQVEVLRGPASALWGSGAIGGVVALTTVDAADLLGPGETAGARVKLGYQGVNDQWLKGVSAYGLLGDSVDLLADIAHRDGGDIELGDGSTLEHSADESMSGLFKFTWTPVADHSLSATLQTFDEQGEVPSNPQIASTPADLVDRDTRQRNLSLRYRFEPADRPLLQPSLLMFQNVSDITERRLADGRLDETEVTTRGFDLRNRSEWRNGAVSHALTVGVDGYEDEAVAERNGGPRPSFPDARQRVVGVYLHDEIRIGDRVTVVPGLRWDRYESDPGTGAVAGQDESALSARLSLSYALTDWLNVHAAYNQAFRAPGMSELFVSGTHFSCGPGCANLFVPNPDLEPETAHNTELGLSAQKTDLFQPDDRLTARLALFRNDVDDFIDQIVDFTFAPVPGNPGRGGVSFFENVSDARLEGFEVEAAYDARRWFARAAYGRTRGENRATGEPLSAIPADELTLGAGIRLAAFELGWKGRFVAEQDRVSQGGTESNGYDLHDLYLTWRPQGFGRDRVRVDVGIDNLFDEGYRPHLSVLDGPGRNVKARVALRF
jgi:hemoglobin/transferrin/lactoferrin receptor protein